MNNPIVKLAVVLIVIVGGGFFGMRAWNAKSAESEHLLDLERLRKEFLLREPMARQFAEPEVYKAEQRALWKWYFSELTDHYNKHPGLKNYDRFIEELDERKSAKKIKEQEFAQYEERFDAVKAFWGAITAGRYDPPFTAVHQGLRFDIHKVESAVSDGEPVVRLHYALWGAQRKWNIDSTSSGARISKLVVSASFQEMSFQGFDADDKLVREMRASGDPFKIDHPERFIEEFPPGVVIGYYDLPKIPGVVTRAELTFKIVTRSVLTGEEAGGSFTWKLPMDQEWKLPEGIGWENAEEQVREEAVEE